MYERPMCMWRSTVSFVFSPLAFCSCCFSWSLGRVHYREWGRLSRTKWWRWKHKWSSLVVDLLSTYAGVFQTLPKRNRWQYAINITLRLSLLILWRLAFILWRLADMSGSVKWYKVKCFCHFLLYFLLTFFFAAIFWVVHRRVRRRGPWNSP